jgi:hypothetical protein
MNLLESSQNCKIKFDERHGEVRIVIDGFQILISSGGDACLD